MFQAFQQHQQDEFHYAGCSGLTAGKKLAQANNITRILTKMFLRRIDIVTFPIAGT